TINMFEDIFVVLKKSTYADKDTLALLTKKRKRWDRKIIYKFVSLNITMDKKQILLEFSRKHLPYFILLNGKCYYCENFLKLDIKNNISSLLLWLSKIGKLKTNLKKIIEANEDSSQNQRIENEDDILK
ncbi:44234_t:CDS:2, partial [Gigaspora margarita]